MTSISSRQTSNSPRKAPTTPLRPSIVSSRSPSTRRSTSKKSVQFVESIAPFRPYRGDPNDPIDAHVDQLLSSRTFELICVQAVQLAALLPGEPPPLEFVSFSATPMHHWYQTLLLDFVESFFEVLKPWDHLRGAACPCGSRSFDQMATLATLEHEVKAHISAILHSFNLEFGSRPLGSVAGLHIEFNQPNAQAAQIALNHVTDQDGSVPPWNWRAGDRLAPEHQRRLKMYETGMMRLLAERVEFKWLLMVPERLNRGIAAFKEYYIRHLRSEILAARAEINASSMKHDVFT